MSVTNWVHKNGVLVFREIIKSVILISIENC